MLSRKVRSARARPGARPRLEALEDRYCPTAIVFAGFVPTTNTINITEMFSNNPNGIGASITLSGNTNAGGGLTTALTIQGGFMTSVNGMNAYTITFSPAAVTTINVTFLNDNNTLTIGGGATFGGPPAFNGVVDLPGAALKVMTGNGTNTLNVGSPNTAIANDLNSVTWLAPANGTGTSAVNLWDAATGLIHIQEGNSDGNTVSLLGVASGSTTITQGNGAGDKITIDRYAVPSTPVPSSLGVTRLTQGTGDGDEIDVSNSATLAFTATQGRGNADIVNVTSASTLGFTLTQGDGNNDAFTVNTATTRAFNATQGDGTSDAITVNGSTTQNFAVVQGNGNGNTITLNTTTTANLTATQGNGNSDAMVLGTTGTGAPATNLATAAAALTQGTGTGDSVTLGSLTATGITTITQQDLPSNGGGDTVSQVFVPAAVGPDARFGGLVILQGSAAGDAVRLGQLNGESVNHTLTVAGTLSVTQNDLPGKVGDTILIGSYTPLTPPFGTSMAPPFTPTPTAIGAVTATTVQTTQGGAILDRLLVAYTTARGGAFVQGNGGDQAVFQKDVFGEDGLFYTGGSGVNYVQADSVSAATGTIDGGGAAGTTFASDFLNFAGGPFEDIFITGFDTVIYG